MNSQIIIIGQFGVYIYIHSDERLLSGEPLLSQSRSCRTLLLVLERESVSEWVRKKKHISFLYIFFGDCHFSSEIIIIIIIIFSFLFFNLFL